MAYASPHPQPLQQDRRKHRVAILAALVGREGVFHRIVTGSPPVRQMALLLDGTNSRYSASNLGRRMSGLGREREFADASSGHSALADPRLRRHASRTSRSRSRPVAQRNHVCTVDVTSDLARVRHQGSLGPPLRTTGDRLQCSVSSQTPHDLSCLPSLVKRTPGNTPLGVMGIRTVVPTMLRGRRPRVLFGLSGCLARRCPFGPA